MIPVASQFQFMALADDEIHGRGLSNDFVPVIAKKTEVKLY